MSADELDVDAELLAMGGDSSDDESDAGGEIAESTQVIESLRTPSEEPKPSVEHVAAEEPPSARRGVAMKVRKNRRKRVTRKEIEDELDDLGDGSSSPARSIASDSAGSADAPGSPADIDLLDDGPDVIADTVRHGLETNGGFCLGAFRETRCHEPRLALFWSLKP